MICQHDLFVGKGLPSACDGATWRAALDSFTSRDLMVTLAGELVYSSQDSGPLYTLKLQPPRLELGHRLVRRFGADRFIEIVMPSPHSREAPSVVRETPDGPKLVVEWLANNNHYLFGRSWLPFFRRDAKKSIKDSKPPHKTITLMQDRIHFFAYDGINFRPPKPHMSVPLLDEAKSLQIRTKMSRCDFLNWTIGLEGNTDQSLPKLFSRLALSKWPTRPLKQTILNRLDLR